MKSGATEPVKDCVCKIMFWLKQSWTVMRHQDDGKINFTSRRESSRIILEKVTETETAFSSFFRKCRLYKWQATRVCSLKWFLFSFFLFVCSVYPYAHLCFLLLTCLVLTWEHCQELLLHFRNGCTDSWHLSWTLFSILSL